MIKFIQCVKAKSDLSIPEFRGHWQEYEKRAQAIAGATDAVRVVANLTLAVEQNLEIQLNRGTSEPFDGVLEISWYNAAGLGKALEDERSNSCSQASRSTSESSSISTARAFSSPPKRSSWSAPIPAIDGPYLA